MRLQIVALVSFIILLPAMATEKMVYGTDDRYEAENYPVQIFRDFAGSTAAAISNSKLRRVGFSGYRIQAKTLSEEINLCPGARFEEQLAAASCSGVLISSDKILTASHCVSDFSACEEMKWVFDFTNKSSYLKETQVYSCKKILASEIDPNTGLDYAIIQLDRQVYNRTPALVARDVEIENGDELVVIGHPSGLPVKIADNGFVRDDDAGEAFFTTNLDTFVYNSGSPVYDKITAKLQGILVRGDTDYTYDFAKGCTSLYKVGKNDGRGEDVVRIDSIPNLGRYLD